MDFQTERYLIEYSKGVFNYFNGKVNPNIPAVFTIRNSFETGLLGRNILSVVKLYLWNIIEHSHDLNDAKCNIIYNIIHELSHVEQDIDLYMYTNSNEYAQLKENENNCNSYSYLFHNIQSIANDLGVIFDYEDIQRYYVYYSKYNTYKTHTVLEYYRECIKAFLYNDMNDNIRYEIDRVFEKDKIGVIINGAAFTIRYDNEINDNTAILNSIISNYANCNMLGSTTTIEEREGITFIVSDVYISYKFNIG